MRRFPRALNLESLILNILNAINNDPWINHGLSPVSELREVRTLPHDLPPTSPYLPPKTYHSRRTIQVKFPRRVLCSLTLLRIDTQKLTERGNRKLVRHSHLVGVSRGTKINTVSCHDSNLNLSIPIPKKSCTTNWLIQSIVGKGCTDQELTWAVTLNSLCDLLCQVVDIGGFQD